MNSFDIDEQIKSLEREIAEYSQKLFEAKGMLRFAVHMKENFNVKMKKRKERAPSCPA